MISEAEAGEAIALGLATALQQYGFIAGVFFMAEVLPHLARLSMCFQGQGQLWHEVQPLLDAILEVLNKMAESAKLGDCEWQKLLAEYILDVKDKADINVGLSATGRSRTSHTTEEDKFLNEFCMPYLDILQTNLVDRFPKEDVSFLGTFQLFDPTASLSIDKVVELLQVAAKHLEKALPDSENAVFNALRSEYSTHNLTMKQKGYVDASESMKALAATMVASSTDPVYPLLATLAARLLVVPASTADCERGFSAVSRIKTSSRNRLATENLDYLMLIDIEGEDIKAFDFQPVVEAWAAARNRRLFRK